mgnify:CR=1 FL=1
MTSFQKTGGSDAVAMNENGKKRPIRAGKAFMAAIADDPQAQQSLAKASLRLRAFATGIKELGVTHHQVIETIGRVFAAFNGAVKELADEHQRLIQAELAPLRSEQERAFAELAEEIQKSQGQVNANLAAHGFDPPQDWEDWEELARLAEKEPGPMTMAEIYDWAIAWAKREIVRRNIARGETPIQTGDKPLPKATRAAEDASIKRDEHDPRIAWCVGKRIYLGDDTQISRLFWLLTSPVGRACTLAEVQRALDGFETYRKDKKEFEDAMKRLRKAISKLRKALHEGHADDHLLIVRGGSAACPEYTMVLRFHEKR